MMSSFRPLGALSMSMSVSKPYLYWSTSILRTRSIVSCTAGIRVLHPCRVQGPAVFKLCRRRSGTTSYSAPYPEIHPAGPHDAVPKRTSSRPRGQPFRQSGGFRRPDGEPRQHCRQRRSKHLDVASGRPMADRDAQARPHCRRNPSPSAHGSDPTLPDEQADPADTATPARSNPICAVSALRPGIAKKRRVGKARRASAEDFARRAPVLAPRASSWSRICRDRADAGQSVAWLRARQRRSRRSPAGSRCRRDAPSPGRRRVISGAGIIRSEAATIAPAPFGPPILCDDRMR